MLAKIDFRNGDFYLTSISDNETPESLGHRMVASTGGFLVCRDNRWSKNRIIVINLSDVKSIVLEEEK